MIDADSYHATYCHRGSILSHPQATCPKCGKTGRKGSITTHARWCGVDWRELFWQKVDKNGPNGCWVWTASRKEKGYGQYLLGKKMHRAHRLAWTLMGRELPARPLELAHSCDNRLCVNPDHLFVATHDENMADCKAKGRHVFGERSIHAKLTEDQVRYIRANYRKTNARRGNGTAIAKLLGISKGIVHAVGQGRTWKHVK
jgi:hypothetical protein